MGEEGEASQEKEEKWGTGDHKKPIEREGKGGSVGGRERGRDREDGSGWKARMRGSDEKCVTGEEKGGKSERRGEREGCRKRCRERKRGRREEKEGVAGRVTEKDCATDGDMESQGRREQEWGAGGARRRGREEGLERRCG